MDWAIMDCCFNLTLETCRLASWFRLMDAVKLLSSHPDRSHPKFAFTCNLVIVLKYHMCAYVIVCMRMPMCEVMGFNTAVKHSWTSPLFILRWGMTIFASAQLLIGKLNCLQHRWILQTLVAKLTELVLISTDTQRQWMKLLNILQTRIFCSFILPDLVETN